jgi:hypothetical protein
MSSMVPYRINLIRTLVPPPARRRLLYRGMLAYLALVLAALGAEVARAYRHIEEWQRQRAEIAGMEAHFRAERPECDGLLAAAAAAQARLGERTQRLEALSRILAVRLPVGRFLSGLLAPLPEAYELASLDLDIARGTLTCDLQVPANGEAPDIPAAELLQHWHDDPMLRRRLRKLEPQATQRRVIGGQSVFILKYSGALAMEEP